MKAKVEIDPGICKFYATVDAYSDDGMNVTLDIQTECENIKEYFRLLQERLPIDAYEELAPNESIIMSIARSILTSKGCCEACVVPVAVYKALQVVSNLALPKDVIMKITKQE